MSTTLTSAPPSTSARQGQLALFPEMYWMPFVVPSMASFQHVAEVVSPQEEEWHDTYQEALSAGQLPLFAR